mmetsp:Transcript_9627/g.27408  ORF Transcript_9627/g.27408 Transcript_9627/m.27408 type:complete len:237 (+) Transcript_9627:111-821(+)|eukprot:CAMPEP_0119547818 /NCGR_PEP_ID=MMETSP1352-20130426/1861_1 /TAXON_ID=265584 /ORGANISM="Stauroneis constricta, Strain CCMP1120" /LENGTH=236 /DNA_ID=CAMNT_0007592861 /DNA_START=20 /DNA_END=730 /DNA_ORIENTATION=+
MIDGMSRYDVVLLVSVLRPASQFSMMGMGQESFRANEESQTNNFQHQPTFVNSAVDDLPFANSLAAQHWTESKTKIGRRVHLHGDVVLLLLLDRCQEILRELILDPFCVRFVAAGHIDEDDQVREHDHDACQEDDVSAHDVFRHKQGREVNETEARNPTQVGAQHHSFGITSDLVLQHVPRARGNLQSIRRRRIRDDVGESEKAAQRNALDRHVVIICEELFLFFTHCDDVGYGDA